METTADKRSLLHSVNFKIPEQCEVNGCRTFLTHFEYIQVSLCCLTAFHKIISIGLNALIRHYKCDFFFPVFNLVSASLTIFPLFLFFFFFNFAHFFSYIFLLICLLSIFFKFWRAEWGEISCRCCFERVLFNLLFFPYIKATTF